MNSENIKTIRFEISDNTFWAIFTALMVLALIGSIGVSSYFYNVRAITAISAGYEEGSVQGGQGVHWIKRTP
jgi:hypothetical protein